MSKGVHKVQRILLELTNSDKDSYPSDEKEFSELVNNSFNTAIEQLLDEVGVNDKTISIPKLELNLGLIKRPFQKENIVSILKDELRQQLLEAVGQQSPDEKTEARTELETLVHFLKTGSLPWWTDELPSAESFRDEAFVSRLKELLFAEGTTAWIERLVEHFDQPEIHVLLENLTSPTNKNTIKIINGLAYKLQSSDTIIRQKISKQLLKRILEELVLKRRNLDSFSEFLTDYITEDRRLRPLSSEEIVDLFEDESIHSLSKEIEQKRAIKVKEEVPTFSEINVSTAASEYETILIHYLTFGSIPPEYSELNKNELDFFLTEFILKKSKKLSDILKANPFLEVNLFEALLDLPFLHFKTVLISAVDKITDFSEKIKESILALSSPSDLSKEIRTFSANLILRQIEKRSAVSAETIYLKSLLTLNETEKLRLKNMLLKAEPDFKTEDGIQAEQSTEITSIHTPETLKEIKNVNLSELQSKEITNVNLKESTKSNQDKFSEEGHKVAKINPSDEIKRSDQKKKITTIEAEIVTNEESQQDHLTKSRKEIREEYFSDLLNYLFETRSWPWWGSLYSKFFTEKISEFTIEKQLEDVVHNFEITYPNAFSEFSINLIQSYAKPSIIFSKLNQETSKKILNPFFPSFKNSFTDIIEAILELIKEHFSSKTHQDSQKSSQLTAFHPEIVSQQLVFYLVDKKQNTGDFVQLINNVITNVGAKLKIPLWEIYGLLIKSHHDLDLKYKLSKEEAVSIFTYNEELEEKYLKLITSSQTDFDLPSKQISDIDFIGNSHEQVVLDYLYGHSSGIRIFPSAWTLGKYISERLRSSAEFFVTLKNNLTTPNFKIIHRILQLEDISRKIWVKDLLPHSENVDQSEEFYHLLKDHAGLNEIALKNIIRASFIKERHWAGERLGIEKLKALLRTISEEVGVSFEKLELELLNTLVKEKEKGVFLREIFADRVGSKNIKTKEEKKSFVEQLREVELKKQLVEFNETIQYLSDKKVLERCSLEFEKIIEKPLNKDQFLLWLNNETTIPAKTELFSFIEKAESEADIKIITSIIKSFFETALIKLEERPLHISMFIPFIRSLAAFEGKGELLQFIESNHFSDKVRFIRYTENIKDVSAKSAILDFIQVQFPDKEIPFTEKQKKDFKAWKDVLNFDVSLPFPETDQILQEERLTSIQNKESQKNESISLSELKETASKLKSDVKDLLNPELSSQKKVTEDTPNIRQKNQTKRKDTPENKDEESENELLQKNPDRLSSETIADIALYLFLNFELPWWSPIKDNLVFEKLVQNLSISSPFILQEKFLEAAEHDPEFFHELISKLVPDDSFETDKLSKEEIETLLASDLTYLLFVLEGKKEHALLKDSIAGLGAKLQHIIYKRENVRDIFKKVAVQLISSTEPEIIDQLRETADEVLADEEWLMLFDKLLYERQLKARRLEAVQKPLEKLEEILNPQGLAKGISITRNLLSVFDWKNNRSKHELVSAWLFMLATYQGTTPQVIAQRIIASKTDHEEDDLAEQLNEIAAIPGNVNTIELSLLPPYTHYISTLHLILDKADVLSAAQRNAAIRLLGGLLQMDELKETPSLPFVLFFDYLNKQHVSGVELIKIIDTIEQTIAAVETKVILKNIRQMADGNYFGDDYGQEIEKANVITGPGDIIQKGISFSVLEKDVKKIISKLRERTPVFEALKALAPGKDISLRKSETKKAVSEERMPREIFDTDPEGRIYIPNAGLVILWPFLTRLFSNLKYTEKGQFIDAEKQLRAVHLTQYLVSFTEDHPEYTLTLNKLLCGVELTEPTERMVYLTEEEKQEARNLLSAVLMQWKEMNNTSTENFQRTFMQREGIIYQKENNWYVRVDHTPFDILLLKLPWGLSIIKYPWNNYLIFVEWKAMN